MTAGHASRDLIDEVLDLVQPDAEAAVVRIRGDRPDGLGDRYRVKTVGPWHVEVIPQLVNWRVCTVRADLDDDEPWESDRHWCYAGRDLGAFVAAILAAHAWDGAEDTEPVGWVKSWDERRHGQGPCRARRAGAR